MSRVIRVVEVVVLAPTLMALSILPILRPSTSSPGRADAVVVLSGDHGERLPVAWALVEKGLVHTLVFAGTPDRAQEEELCQTRGTVEYICLRPQPDNTRAEAQAVARLARSRHWRRVVVVTTRYHVTRSRLLFRHCFDGEVRMMAGDPAFDRAQLTGLQRVEWAKVMYTIAVRPGC